jgi:hypothetical protein
LNVHGVNDVRKREILTVKPLVPKPSSLEFEIATENLKRHKSSDTDQIPTEIIQVVGNILCFEIHNLINSIWNEEQLPQQWKEYIIVTTTNIYRTDDKFDAAFIEKYHFYQLHNKSSSNILLLWLTPCVDEIIWDHQREYRRNRPTADHMFYICQVLEKKWEYNRTIHQLFIDCEKAYHSVRREVLYNILIQFVIPLKLVTIIKVYLNETYSKVCIRKNPSDAHPIQNGLK